jgi:hypothetical protein
MRAQQHRQGLQTGLKIVYFSLDDAIDDTPDDVVFLQC